MTWGESRLGEVIELKRGYDLPTRLREPGPYPIVSSSGVTDHHAEAKVKGPGVVTGRYGTIGEVFYIESDYWPLNTALYVRDFKGNNPRFISYFLRIINFRAYTDKAAVPGVNRNHLHQALVTIPELPEQQAIADILGTLDDKIALNRKMNRTLEEIAQTLFRAWFVDFEGETDLVESEVGLIPRGWEVGTIGEDFKLTMGQSPPGSTYNENGEGLPFYQGATDFGFRYPALRVYCTEPKRVAERGDTLVSVRAPVGRVNRAASQCCVGRGVAALRHNSGSESYTYFVAKQLEERFERFNAEGTVFGSIGKKDFSKLRVVRPPLDWIERFSEMVGPIDSRLEVAVEESETLAEIRDTLLPKLISGEIRVPEAEEVVGEAV